MEKYIGSKHSGKFSIDDERQLFGDLNLDRRNSSLYLWDDEFFHLNSPKCLFGTLHDLTKVSLLHLVTTNSGSQNRDVYFEELFPNFILFGDKHIAADEKCIKSIQFTIYDSTTLFYDYDAFGSILEPECFISDLVNSQINSIKKYSPEGKFERSIATGKHPIITYFTGKRKLVEVDTEIGRVNIFHNPTHDMGDANGISIKNEITCELEFNESIIFDEAFKRMRILTSFLELAVGRRQEITKSSVQLTSEDENLCNIDIYSCNDLKQSNSKDWRNEPHPGDNLIDAIRNPEEFNQLIQRWLNNHVARKDARNQFREAFIDESYTTDRLVKTANMFDILPEDVFSEKEPLDSEMESARLQCRKVFKAFPQSIERDGILGALGRMGDKNLKKKIRERVLLITNVVGDKFHDLSFITDHSVDCRNYFVHGGKRKFDYYDHFEAIAFFIDTLEFVFAASELIEFGWDINKWISNGSVQAHPFGAYRVNYDVSLNYLYKITGKIER